jgi:hypothetical protein
VLVLHGRHDFELGAAAAAELPENAQLFGFFLARLRDLGEEHEAAPLFFHGPQRVAAAAHHEPDTILGHVHHLAGGGTVKREVEGEARECERKGIVGE